MNDAPAATAGPPMRRLILAVGLGAAATLAWMGLSLAGAAWLDGSLSEGVQQVVGSGLLFVVFALGLALMAALAFWFVRRVESAAAVERVARYRERALLELMPDWYWETDVDHRLTRLRPPGGHHPADWPVASRLGRPLWEDFCSPASQWDAHRQMLDEHRPFQGLHAYRREPDGRVSLWTLHGMPRFDAEGRFCGYQGIARDVSTSAGLFFDRRVGTHLLDAVPSAVVLAHRPDPAEGSAGGFVIRHCNEVAARHLGETAARLAGRDLVATLAAAADWPVTQVCTDLGLPAPDLSQEAADEGAMWQARTERFTFEHGGLQCETVVVVFTPAPARDEAAQLERLAAERELESFSYTVSHDLRAPIRVVEGFTKILKEDYGRSLDRIGNDHLDRVLGAAARMNSMIDALLALSQLSAKPVTLQPVNLSQLASYVIEDLRRQSPERVVDVRIQDGMTAQGDPTLLRVVLDNLLGNAWKYSGKRERAQIEFACETQGGRAVYRVRDNGAGFDMRFADRLFGVFQRLHSASDFQGTGVGLASVQRIIRRHGGQIWAESEVGQGATFYFTLGEARRT
jgi:signal transduction histidine kinase/PAS domain-containing protein